MTETQTVNVLLIEDNPGDTRLMSEWLYSIQQPQFEVEVKETLSDGIDYLKNNTVDVVLLDLSLPDSTGVETVRRTRAKAPDVAIVVTTGFDNRQSGIDAVKAGAQDYLVKGNFDTSLLERSLIYAIERQRDAAALRRSEEEYRSLINDVFNNSTVAVFILDRTLRVVWMNDASEEYFQLPRERALTHEWDDLLEKHFAQILGSSIRVQDTLLEPDDDRTECYIMAENGRSERWLEYTMKPIHAGMYSGGFIVQFTDITRMKHSEEAEHRQRLLAEALRDTAGALSSTLDLDEVLDRILNSLEQVMQHDGANVMLLEDDMVFIVRQQPSSSATSTPAKHSHRITDLPYLQHMYTTDQTLVCSDIGQDERWKEAPERKNWKAYAGAPIRLEDEIIGFINLYSELPGYYRNQDGEQLEIFSRQAAVAMRNAQLYQKRRELATMQERQRLARDLHDAVTQSLFTSTIMAETALRQWENRPERAYDLLKQVHQLTVGALAEMRVLLLELRPNTLVNVSLDQLLQQYVLSLQSRGHVKVELMMDPVPMLLPDIKIALYRIVQEALNNITKHAGASKVDITIENLQDRLILTVEDNGCGFDITRVAPTSLGLSGMRERTEEIGAELHVESKIGTGTTIQVTWPIQELL
jgi:PAS domain S-box-containing protein